jgi:DNA-binding beta-propeller fold protein YncE
MNSDDSTRILPPAPHLRTAAFAVSVTLLAGLSWACRRESATSPPPYIAFVANQQGNSLAAVDLASLKMRASIPLPASPVELAARPGSQELYVVSSSGEVSVIACPSLRVTKILKIGKSASSLVFAPHGRRAYVLAPSDGQLVFLDCEKQKEMGRLNLSGKPSSLSLTPDGKTLIATVAPSDLHFVNAETQSELRSVKVGIAPGPMVIQQDGAEVFVANTGEKTVSAVDVHTRQLLSNLAVAAPITSLSLKPDGGEIFAVSSEGSAVIILDAFHDDVEETLTAGLHPVAGVFRRDSSAYYIASAGDGNITALDVQTRSVLGVAHAGTQLSALALTPDERFLAVTDSASSSLAVLRADKLGLVTTIPVGADPVDVIIPDWLPKK